jgi:glycosyltransferase involved in cell wall biosynthesis
MGARAKLAREVELCVLPNEDRARVFREQTKTQKPVECVWNVPGLEEIGPRKPKPNLQTPLKLFYGGSLAPARLSPLFLQEIIKLAGQIELEIVGYATYAAQKYIKSVVSMNKETGRKTITYHGALSRRSELLAVADSCEAALCLMPMSSEDLNMRTMAGASNKPFDVMARGLAVVVSDIPDWKRLYLPGDNHENGKGYWISDMGYGIAINPECEESIRGGLEWMLGNREKLWEMGERGRLNIKKDWNYKTKIARIKRIWV